MAQLPVTTLSYCVVGLGDCWYAMQQCLQTKECLLRPRHVPGTSHLSRCTTRDMCGGNRHHAFLGLDPSHLIQRPTAQSSQPLPFFMQEKPLRHQNLHESDAQGFSVKRVVNLRLLNSPTVAQDSAAPSRTISRQFTLLHPRTHPRIL